MSAGTPGDQLEELEDFGGSSNQNPTSAQSAPISRAAEVSPVAGPVRGRPGQVDTGPANPNEPTWTAGFNPYAGHGYYNPFVGWFGYWQGGMATGTILGPEAAAAQGIALLGGAEYSRIGGQLASCCVGVGAGYIGGGPGGGSPGLTTFPQMGSGSPPAAPPTQPNQSPAGPPNGSPPADGGAGTTGPPATAPGSEINPAQTPAQTLATNDGAGWWVLG